MPSSGLEALLEPTNPAVGSVGQSHKANDRHAHTRQSSGRVLDLRLDPVRMLSRTLSYPHLHSCTGAADGIVSRWLRTRSRDEVVISAKIAGRSPNIDWLRSGVGGRFAANTII